MMDGIQPKGRRDPSRPAWARQVEGWQPGIAALVVAGISALLAMPKAVEPTELPEPWLRPSALRAAALADVDLARRAEAKGLDFDTRSLGSALRAYGRADALGVDKEVVAARKQVSEAARKAIAQGETAVLELRGYQLRSFLQEVDRWEVTHIVSNNLRDLGGPFVSHAIDSGWVRDGHLLLDPTARAVLFKKRFDDLCGLHGPAFDPSADEERALLRFLLQHPPVEELRGPVPPVRNRRSILSTAADIFRLRKIDELAQLDPTYPRDLARGVVLYRLHRYPLSLEAFRSHLDSHPEGPDTLRAQNYLRAALERARED